MNEFLQSPAGLAAMVFGAIFGLIGLVAAGNKFYHFLKWQVQGYPNEALIEAALLPLLYKAIMAAYRASERLMDAVGERLHGADKARIARLVYQYLPDTVSIAGISWRWKAHIDEHEFAAWLQERFGDFADWWDTAEAGILEAIRPEGEPTDQPG